MITSELSGPPGIASVDPRLAIVRPWNTRLPAVVITPVEFANTRRPSRVLGNVACGLRILFGTSWYRQRRPKARHCPSLEHEIAGGGHHPRRIRQYPTS